MPPHFYSMRLCTALVCVTLGTGPLGDLRDRTEPYLCLSCPNLVPCSAYVTLFEFLKADGTNSHNARAVDCVSGCVRFRGSASLISRKVQLPHLPEVTAPRECDCLLEGVLNGKHFSLIKLLEEIPLCDRPCVKL